MCLQSGTAEGSVYLRYSSTFKNEMNIFIYFKVKVSKIFKNIIICFLYRDFIRSYN